MSDRPSAKLAALGVAVIFVIGACSESDPTSDPEVGSVESPATTSPESDPRKGHADKSSDARKDESKDGRRSPSDSSDDSDGSDHAADDGAAADATYPAAGRYSYDQDGYEEFCQATCSREDLPPTQTVETSYSSRTSSETVVVSEARASDDRSIRTVTRYTSRHAFITEVETTFSFGSFTFSRNYEPRPPVDSLRFPLEEGEEWSGSWKARTSGDYSIAVVDREVIAVGGRRVSTFRLDTHTRFEGEFDGRADVVLWYDPRSHNVVKTTGTIDVRSDFGRYRTKFETLLRSAPD